MNVQSDFEITYCTFSLAGTDTFNNYTINSNGPAGSVFYGHCSSLLGTATAIRSDTKYEFNVLSTSVSNYTLVETTRASTTPFYIANIGPSARSIHALCFAMNATNSAYTTNEIYGTCDGSTSEGWSFIRSSLPTGGGTPAASYELIYDTGNWYIQVTPAYATSTVIKVKYSVINV